MKLSGINCYIKIWKWSIFERSRSKVKGQGQGRAKGEIHLIGYNFAYNCHRDFKLGSYFSLWKATPNMTLTLIFDLDLEKFTQGQKFLNID